MELPVAERKSSPVYLKLKDKSWIYQDLQLWNEIKNLIPSLHELRFTGGEPMLIERHYDFLEKCIAQGVAKNIIIE
jgi:organic radical activating enzyme